MTTLWKIYFWLLALSFAYIVTSETYLSLQQGTSELIDIIIRISFIIGVAGVFGYAYKKKILNTAIWKLVFFIELFLYVITICLFASIYEPGIISTATDLLNALLILFYSLPEIIALYLYSYKSKDIWL